MTYLETERRRASAWKQRTTTLPAAARAGAPWTARPGRSYDFCLRAEHAALNLLPEVREAALSLFAAEGVHWHAETTAGPTNHLLSEVPHGDRTRGARCTSVDAAFLHRRGNGAVELALVEWKYTESYALRRPEPAKDEERRRRYERALKADDSPVRSDLLPFELLLDEPIYQLVRQQLLAHELEKARAHGADLVRVVHVLAPGNVAYQQSLVREETRALGTTVGEVWDRLLRRPDRFTRVDPAVFLDAAVTSPEYVSRYGASA